ncbi:MAG: methionyl-tRNA formyltransferase [Mollicutes bacterium]|nr:methionyl-tRNA formyltransferase [Mollicutes bacterium]MDD7263897.1 methionyl-tRNA formyltransferase [bacterium]MDY4979779.1 methionyl-tRNA formyltransferase [Candidatus Onthovivens sp.]
MENFIKKKNLKILYFGTPDISATVLELLIKNNYNIIGVVAQMDKEKDRKGRILEVPTKVIAKKYNIPVYQKEKIRLDFEFIKELKPDIILTMAYGQLIPHDLLMIPKYGCYNLHGSLLPQYRGAAPIQFALLNGDKITGVTLMEMVDKMDAGKMYYKKEIQVLDDDNYTSLKKKIAMSCFEVFDEGIEDVVNKINVGEEQDESKVTFTSKIDRDLEKLNFNDDSSRINNIIRALSYEPGTYFSYKNIKFKVFKALAFTNLKIAEPGTIIKYDKQGFCIATQDGYIEILELQKPGKNIMSFKDFYNGMQHFFTVGEHVE